MKNRFLIAFLFGSLIFAWTGCEKAPETTPNDNTFTDSRDGQVYKTVVIGTKTWMAENLRFNVAGSISNLNSTAIEYGRLYTFDEASSACPNGWHLPTDQEWKALEMALGMSATDADDTGYRGIIASGMRSTAGWDNNNNGSNTSGFNALPSGGAINGLSWDSSLANFWTATESTSTRAWHRALGTNQGVYRGTEPKTLQYSCRCIKN